MSQLPTWRVHVMRKVEDWVEVQAADAQLAESAAYNVPGVISVFGRSALPGNQPIEGDRPAGVND